MDNLEEFAIICDIPTDELRKIMFRLEEAYCNKERNMRTFHTGELIFHYNGDFSGPVVITVPLNAVEDGLSGKQLVTIPFRDLLAVVMEYIRYNTIKNFESMTTDDLMEWVTPGFDSDGMTSCSDRHDDWNPMHTVKH